MSDTNEIPTESKIIIGVEYSEKTKWYSLHLHDALFAVSIRPMQERVVISEGRGPGRLRHLRIPFKNIFRFEAVEVPIGHSCLSAPVDAGQLGERHLTPEGKPFTPVMVRLLIKHSTRNDFISIHDLGATPLPILVPLLRNLPEDRLANANISLRSADDCFILSRKVVDWVHDVNASIESALSSDVETVVTEGARPISQTAENLAYEKLRRVFAGLDSYSKSEVQETLISSLAEIRVSTLLQPHLMEKNSRMVNAARFRYYNHPLNLASQIDDPASSVTIEHLVEASKLYHEKTGQSIEGVLDAIVRRVGELEQRRQTVAWNKETGLLEENAPKPTDIIDPTKIINEKQPILSGNQLRHEDELRRVFENEGIEVCYVSKLPFLSLLVEYQTEDGEKYAAIIKEGLHQALREFLLAHEMGHWFLHVNAKSGDRFEQMNRWLRSSAQHRFLEEEADNFAMAVLFPAPYLADHVTIYGGLTVENLFNEFVAGMNPVGEKLRAQMLHYIRDHIEKLKRFKKAKEPSFLTIEVESVEESDLEVLLTLIRKGKDPVDWVRLDENSFIVEASQNAGKLFGRSNEEIILSKPTELVIPEEVKLMVARSEYRRKKKKAIYYITEVTNKAENTTRKVIVYSFPILNNGQYVGAIAALRPLDEFESEASSFGLSREEVAQWNNVHLIDFSDVTSAS